MEDLEQTGGSGFLLKAGMTGAACMTDGRGLWSNDLKTPCVYILASKQNGTLYVA